MISKLSVKQRLHFLEFWVYGLANVLMDQSVVPAPLSFTRNGPRTAQNRDLVHLIFCKMFLVRIDEIYYDAYFRSGWAK